MSRKILLYLIALVLLAFMAGTAQARLYWTRDGEGISEIQIQRGHESTVQITSDDRFNYGAWVGPSDGSNYVEGDAAKIIDVINLPAAGLLASAIDMDIDYPGWWYLEALNYAGGGITAGDHWDVIIRGMTEGTEILTSDYYEGAGFTSDLVVTVVPGYILTVQAEPNDIGIDTVTPSVGQHECLGQVDISAEPFPSCPDVYYFDHWEGDVAEPNSSSTRVDVYQDKTITAVYVVGERQCGDLCHPILQGDLNADCYVNFEDFALYCEQWLSCTHPDCD